MFSMNDMVDSQDSKPLVETNLQNAVFGFGLHGGNEEQDDFLDDIEQFFSVSGENPQPPSLAHELMAQSNMDRRKSKTPISIQERHVRTLEKNRRAQKKYRDKQKIKYSAMELQVDQLSQKIQSLEIEKKELNDRAELLERILRDKETSSSSPQSSSHEPIDQAADSEKIKQAEGCIHFSGFNKTVSSDMIRNMHVPEVEKYLLDVWESIVQEMSVLLKEVEVEQPHPEKLQKLSDIVNQCDNFVMRLFTINPVQIKSFICQMDNGNPHEYFRDADKLEEFTRQIIKKMELTEQQKAIVTFLWNRFQSVQKECMAQRKQIAVQLQNLQFGCDTQWNFFEEFMKTHELLLRIRENWRQSYRNHWDFMSLISTQIFTPVQYAKYIVYMYPLCCDDFVFCKVVAQDLEAASQNKNNRQQNQPNQTKQQSFNQNYSTQNQKNHQQQSASHSNFSNFDTKPSFQNVQNINSENENFSQTYNQQYLDKNINVNQIMNKPQTQNNNQLIQQLQFKKSQVFLNNETISGGQNVQVASQNVNISKSYISQPHKSLQNNAVFSMFQDQNVFLNNQQISNACNSPQISLNSNQYSLNKGNSKNNICFSSTINNHNGYNDNDKSINQNTVDVDDNNKSSNMQNIQVTSWEKFKDAQDEVAQTFVLDGQDSFDIDNLLVRQNSDFDINEIIQEI